MLKKGLFILMLVMLTSGYAFAEASVKSVSISVGVENLEPFEAGTSFKSDVEKLYCFVRMLDAEPLVKHLWYYGDKLMAEVTLDIKSKNYRTYSSKKILAGWTGEWRVDVVSSEGQVLESVNFTIG